MDNLAMLKCCAILFSLFCLNAVAADVKAVIFGDSLADEGRLYEITNHQLPNPTYYFEGRYSNGRTWPEYAFKNRENYAIAGAKSDTSNFLKPLLGSLVDDTGLLSQVDEYIAAHPEAEDNTVFYIAIGGNDVFDLDMNDEDALKALIPSILGNIQLAMDRLKAIGGKHFALVNLPDLATAPLFNDASRAEQALLTGITDAYNKGLKELAAQYDAQYIDMDGFQAKIIKHPRRYHFTNIDDACFNEVTFEICDNPDEYMSWDNAHPTTRVHEMFAATVK
jgi:outer membrane lipase/esterase